MNVSESLPLHYVPDIVIYHRIVLCHRLRHVLIAPPCDIPDSVLSFVIGDTVQLIKISLIQWVWYSPELHYVGIPAGAWCGKEIGCHPGIKEE